MAISVRDIAWRPRRGGCRRGGDRGAGAAADDGRDAYTDTGRERKGEGGEIDAW